MNHIIGKKYSFLSFDETIKNKIMFGDHNLVSSLGKVTISCN